MLRKGKITFGNGAFEVECQLRDLNSTGAKLKLFGDGRNLYISSDGSETWSYRIEKW